MVTDGKVDLPTWDLTPIYPGVDSPEYAASVVSLIRHIEDLESLLAGAEAQGASSGGEVTAAFEQILDAFNDALRLPGKIGCTCRHISRRIPAITRPLPE